MCCPMWHQLGSWLRSMGYDEKQFAFAVVMFPIGIM
jgi:hypothetical protein